LIPCPSPSATVKTEGDPGWREGDRQTAYAIIVSTTERSVNETACHEHDGRIEQENVNGDQKGSRDNRDRVVATAAAKSVDKYQEPQCDVNLFTVPKA
jgi:hypothetical protein